VQDLVDDGRSGRVVAPDADAMAVATDELLGSDDLRAGMAERAVAAAETRRFEPAGRLLASHLAEVVARRSAT
jgi:hypothetical protein